MPLVPVRVSTQGQGILKRCLSRRNVNQVVAKCERPLCIEEANGSQPCTQCMRCASWLACEVLAGLAGSADVRCGQQASQAGGSKWC